MKPSDFLQDIGRPMAYYPKLRKATGSTTATIMLCNLIYWRGKESGPDGWLYKTAEEIEDETGLSYREQQSARKQLVKQELVEERYQRLDHKMYFRINLQVLDTKWSHCFSRNDRSSVRETTDRQFDETTDRQFVINNIDYTPNTSSSAPLGKVDAYKSFMDTWNSNIEGTPFPSIVAMTDKRKKAIRDLLVDSPDALNMLVPVINYLSGIEFFTGENKNKWVASFDYLLQKGKLIEHYEKCKNKQKPTVPDKADLEIEQMRREIMEAREARRSANAVS